MNNKKYTLIGFIKPEKNDEYPQVVTPFFKGEDNAYYWQQDTNEEKIEGFVYISKTFYDDFVKEKRVVKLKTDKVVSVGSKRIYALLNDKDKVVFASKKAFDKMMSSNE